MYKDRQCIAIILAAGNGTRFGGSIPKQFLQLGELPVFMHSLLTFQQDKHIDEIYLVLANDYIEHAKDIIKDHDISKIKAIVTGGNTRMASVSNALEKITAINTDIILTHDAARPFVTKKNIHDILEAVFISKAAILAIPIIDTIKYADKDGFSQKTISREDLYKAQTPQAFLYGIIEYAYERANAVRLEASDDAACLEYIAMNPKIIESSVMNIKITSKQDLEYAQHIFSYMNKNVN